MSVEAFPFRSGMPIVPILLGPPEPPFRDNGRIHRHFEVDTGFSDYLQLDWEAFVALELWRYAYGEMGSRLADGSRVTDYVSRVRITIPACGIDAIVRCISNRECETDMLLAGASFLRAYRAVIDYGLEQVTLAG